MRGGGNEGGRGRREGGRKGGGGKTSRREVEGGRRGKAQSHTHVHVCTIYVDVTLYIHSG